jgi:hypothetical protein
MFYSGSLERVGPEPWQGAAQEKGFLTFDLESGISQFHSIPGRPVVALAPIRIRQGEAEHLTSRVREVLEEVPGGIDGKIVRLRVEGLSPEEVRKEDEGLFAPLRDRALHLAIEVDDFRELGEDNPLPLVSRDRGSAFRLLRERLREEERGEEAQHLLEDLLPAPPSAEDPVGLEEDLLIRELQGSNLPRLGDLSMEAREGLVAWVGGDGRVLRAFLGNLLWGVGISGPPDGEGSASVQGGEPSLALKLGVNERSFWVRSGTAESPLPGEGSGDAVKPWGISPKDVVEGHLEGGARVLAAVRGADGLAALMEELESRYSGLRRDLPPSELSPRDFHRLRIEAELADMRAQLRALMDIPHRVVDLEVELRDLRASAAEMAGDLEAGTMDWHRERQDAQTHLQAYRDQARELQARIRKLEDLGPDTPCPTCGRILEAHSEKVLLELKEEWEALVQDGRWWRRRWEQLETKPEDLQGLEGNSLRLHAAVEDATERLERARSSLRELDDLRVRERQLKARLEMIASDRTEGPSGPALPQPLISENENGLPEAPPQAFLLSTAAEAIHGEILGECRTRLLHRGGRRLNRLTGGRVLGLHRGGESQGEVQLVDAGGSAGVEADKDRAAAVVALRMALVELLAEDWSPLGSFILGDPFDGMAKDPFPGSSGPPPHPRGGGRAGARALRWVV